MNKVWLARSAFAAVLVSLLLATAGTVPAQEKPEAKKGPAATMLEQWNEVGNKLIAMAQDWPADKYDYRPAKEQRTFAEQLLHMAGSNYYATYKALGSKEKPEENPSRATYKTKEQVVAYVKKSVADGAAAIQKVGDEGVLKDLGYWSGLTEHMGEHYGQLVCYYRSSGLVPPESRPKK